MELGQAYEDVLSEKDRRALMEAAQVFNILGMTVDGMLLALGAEPSVGIVATPDKTERLTGPPPRLWA